MNVVKKFDYCLSNPPYQIESKNENQSNNSKYNAKEANSDNKNNSTSTSQRLKFSRIFDKFQVLGISVAEKTTMIYPSSWQSSILKGFGKFLIDNGLYSVKDYNGNAVFGRSIKDNYPVSIVQCFHEYTGQIFSNDTTLQRDSTIWINTSTKNILINKTQHFPKLNNGKTNKKEDKSNGNGVYDLTDLKNIENTTDVRFLNSSENLSQPVRIYIKKTSGTKADGGFYYAERSEILQHYINPQELDKYNVSTQAMFFKQIRNFKEVDSGVLENFGARISLPNEGFSNTWVNVKSFETLEEAENFVKYFNNRLITVLAGLEISRSKFASLVPDLKDYSNNNPDINWNESLDEQLYKLFNLSEEEITVIENEK